MIICYRGWQRLAALLLTCSSTTVWAQLPSQKPSPLNQLGRTFGFGISDGYHECPECKARPNLPSAMASGTTVNHPRPCVDCEKQSMFSRMNPFKDSKMAGQAASSNMPMTVLPPSPQMYQQFAAPCETPLAGSNIQPTNPNTIHNMPSPDPNSSGSPGLFPQGNFPPASGSQVPDPVEMNTKENDAQSSEATPGQDAVPPPPVLRKKQKGDKPLGEQPTSTTPGEKVPADSIDKTDDSLDLLPKDETPPITISPKGSQSRSLISHITSVPNERSSSPKQVQNESMLRQYYGNAYLRRDASNENAPNFQRDEQRAVEFMPPTINRYR